MSKAKAIIGFTNKYYTLWTISKVERYISNGYIVEDTVANYHQNLSMNKDKAIEKFKKINEGTEVEIDLELRGFNRIILNDGYRPKDNPELFQFGKYECLPIIECSDVEYVKWYALNCSFYPSKQIAHELLLETFKYVENDGYNAQYLNNDEYEIHLIESKKQLEFEAKENIINNRIESLENGLVFDNKKRLELYIKVLRTDTYDDYFGTIYTYEFETKCGKYIKYKGGKKLNLSKDKFIKVKGTIKHIINDMDYELDPETKLQRIVIL